MNELKNALKAITNKAPEQILVQQKTKFLNLPGACAIPQGNGALQPQSSIKYALF